MLNELYLRRISEAWYPHTPEGFLWSQKFGEAGRLLESAFLRALEVFNTYIPLSYVGNSPNGAVWDLKTHSRLYSPALAMKTINIKATNVENICSIGDLDITLPFHSVNRKFTLRYGQEVIQKWMAGVGFPTLKLLKPATEEVEGVFVKNVQYGNWRLVAKLMAEQQWKHTQLGHHFNMKFFFEKRGLLTSVSIRRGPNNIVEYDIAAGGNDDDDNATLFANPMEGSGVENILPPREKFSTRKEYAKVMSQAFTQPHIPRWRGVWEARELPVFMRTKVRNDGGHTWRLQYPGLVNEPTSIITEEAFRSLYNSLPVGSL